jgi:hypothetical protein
MIRKIFCSTAMLLSACSTALTDDIRRVVTGLDDNSHAIVLYDRRVPLQVRAIRNRRDEFVDHRLAIAERVDV